MTEIFKDTPVAAHRCSPNLRDLLVGAKIKDTTSDLKKISCRALFVWIPCKIVITLHFATSSASPPPPPWIAY